MAVVKLYKYKVDTEAYEDMGAVVSQAVHTRYRNPLYTTELYPISCVRARYGDDYVDVWEAEIEVDWKPVDWKKLNESS